MNDMRIPDTRTNGTRKRRGAPTLYAERTVSTTFSIAPAIRQRLMREVNYRNSSEDTKYWTESKIVVEVLAKHFGLDLTNTGSN